MRHMVDRHCTVGNVCVETPIRRQRHENALEWDQNRPLAPHLQQVFQRVTHHARQNAASQPNQPSIC